MKKLNKGDTAWLLGADNKAVKIISALLTHLPEGYQYKVLFMRRPLDEVLASQAKMLVRRGEEQSDDAQMKTLFTKHLAQVEQFMVQHPTLDALDVDYTALAQNPMGQLPNIVQFLGKENEMELSAMAAIADPSLYRNRQG